MGSLGRGSTKTFTYPLSYTSTISLLGAFASILATAPQSLLRNMSESLWHRGPNALTWINWLECAVLQDAKDADESAAEEKEEAQEVVEGLKASGEDALKLILTTFTLVFAAEWGDKSFLATIALAAASSPLGVTAGAVAGHGVATGLAVAGGGFLSRYFSETFLQYVGGSLFLVFAAATVFDLVEKTL